DCREAGTRKPVATPATEHHREGPSAGSHPTEKPEIGGAGRLLQHIESGRYYRTSRPPANDGKLGYCGEFLRSSSEKSLWIPGYRVRVRVKKTKLENRLHL